MDAKNDDIRIWLRRGANHGASHVIVCDGGRDRGGFPVFVNPGENPKFVASRIASRPATNVVECYDLGLDLEMQVSERQARHWDMHPEPEAPRMF